MMRVTRHQLLVAVPIAVAVHAAAAAAVFWIPPPAGARAVGLGGIEVSLGPTGGAPGDVATPVPQTVAAAPVETPDAPEIETLEAVAVPVEEVVEELPSPAEPDLVIPVEVASPPPPLPRVKPKPPEPERAPPPPDPDPAPEIAPQEVAAVAPSVAGAGGKSGTQDSAEAGSADDVSGGGTPGVSADYTSYLLAWLQKHKEYPRAAQRRRQQGTALLYFEMDRSGNVHRFEIRKSSGHVMLDREVVALLQRAAPLPPPPPEVRGARIELVVPVQFFLR